MNKRDAIGLFAAAVLLIVGLFIISNYGNYGQTQKVSINESAQRAIDYINTQMVKGNATINGTKELLSVYKINTSYRGKIIPVFTSKDGKYLFLEVKDMSKNGTGG